MPGRRALPLATAIMAGGLAATAVAPVLPAVLAGLATVGIGWSCFLGTTIAILQSADPCMLGRVMSLFALVLLGGASADAPVASSLSTSLGPRAPFAAGAAAAIAALAVAVGRTRTRPSQAERRPATRSSCSEEKLPGSMACASAGRAVIRAPPAGRGRWDCSPPPGSQVTSRDPPVTSGRTGALAAARKGPARGTSSRAGLRRVRDLCVSLMSTPAARAPPPLEVQRDLRGRYG
jgi:MFS family permease